jgi:hypothetical protein
MRVDAQMPTEKTADINPLNRVSAFTLLAGLLVSGAVACDPITEFTCGREYSQATLSHLPLQRESIGCDSFVCPMEQATAIHRWTQEIRVLADRQDDRCVAAAYREWAWYYDRKADKDATKWQETLRARAIEAKLKDGRQ